MTGLLNILLITTLLFEVCVFTYAEWRAWRTFCTPLCCLMLPYIFVLLVTIMIAGKMGFVQFNYESLYVWIVGLPLFALPSWTIAAVLQKGGVPVKTQIEERGFPRIFIIISVLLCLAFAYKLKQTLSSSSFIFGTDDFAEDFSGHGIWPHLREILMPLLIISIYYVKKSQWWLWILILSMLTIQFLYMVKGVIIIAVLSGILMRLYAGKMRLNVSLILKVIFGGILVFFLTYMVIPLLGNDDGEASMELVEFVMGHFFHYFTSGTLGFSYDIDLGLPDLGSFDIIVSPFLNIINVITGQKELLSPVNPYYFNTGITLTNVRTFFGTLYIYTTPLTFALYTIVASAVMYAIKYLSVMSKNIFVHTIDFYFCGLMAMGWFEFYLFHLSIIEVPIMTIILAVLARLTIPKVELKLGGLKS